MAKYLILVYGDEQEWTTASPAAAISLASQLPELSERAGAIEVRPIHENA